MKNKIIDRAAELLRKDPSIKYFEAIEIAKGENNVKANNSRRTSCKR